MPIYEYLCESCGHRFERLRPLSEASGPAACPQCHREAKRILSSPNVNTWRARIIPPTGSGRQM